MSTLARWEAPGCCGGELLKTGTIQKEQEALNVPYKGITRDHVVRASDEACVLIHTSPLAGEEFLLQDSREFIGPGGLGLHVRNLFIYPRTYS